MVDLSAGSGWLDTTLACIALIQAVLQARWPDEPAALLLPNIEHAHLPRLARAGLGHLPLLLEAVTSGGQGGAGAEAGAGTSAGGGSGSASMSRDRAVGVLSDLLGGAKAKEVVAVSEQCSQYVWRLALRGCIFLLSALSPEPAIVASTMLHTDMRLTLFPIPICFPAYMRADHRAPASGGRAHQAAAPRACLCRPGPRR